MNLNRSLINAFLFLFSFFVTAFGQPAWIRGFGVLAAVFGFALFWKGMLSFSRPRDRFLLAMTWFSAVQAVQLSWLATTDYMGPLILFLYLFLILAMGVQFGLISLMIQSSISWHRAACIASCWVIFEWTRLFFLCGFTWNPAGLALADSSYSLQLASVCGIFGLSFWVIFVNASALKAWTENATKSIAIWAFLAVFPYFFGFLYQHWVESHVQSTGNLSVALIQTHLSPEQKEFSALAPEAYIPPLTQWKQILSALENQEVDLIVLPEAALPLGAHTASYPFSEVEKYFDQTAFPRLKTPLERSSWKVSNAFLLQALANQYNAHVIVGLDDRDFSGKYNAAFHFVPENRPYERYEKQVLVPVGEYIPVRHSRRLAQFIGDQFGIYSSFDAGTEGKVFKAQIPIGISICLEETFGQLVRELRVKGAQLLVNVTNDAWFPNSKLPRQHFDHGRVRAAENGVPLLRACNSGISGGVDAFGQPMQPPLECKEKASSLYFSFPLRSYSTLYTWWGDRAILGISFSFMLSYFFFRKKKLP